MVVPGEVGAFVTCHKMRIRDILVQVGGHAVHGSPRSKLAGEHLSAKWDRAAAVSSFSICSRHDLLTNLIMGSSHPDSS